MTTGEITHLPAEIVRQLLVDKSLVAMPPTVSDWPAFVSQRPSRPDNCLVLFDTSGTVDSRNMVTGESIEYLGIEILLRSSTYPKGRKKIAQLAYTIDTTVAYDSVTVESTDYRIDTLNKQSGPFSLGKERESDRYLFSLNYLVAIVKTGT